MEVRTFTIPAGLTMLQMKNHVLGKLAEFLDMHLVGANDEKLGMLTMATNGEAGFTLWSTNSVEDYATASFVSTYKGAEFYNVNVRGINSNHIVERKDTVRGQNSFTVNNTDTYHLYYDKTEDGLAFYLSNTAISKTMVRYVQFVTRSSDNRYAYFAFSPYFMTSETGGSSSSGTTYYMFTLNGETCIYTTASNSAEWGMMYSYYSSEAVDDLVVLQNVLVPALVMYFPNLYVPIKRLSDIRANVVELDNGDEYLVVGMNTNSNLNAYQMTPVYYLQR